nr:uncharacterized protein LOC117686629 isoform X3 [Crassostrea gigas]
MGNPYSKQTTYKTYGMEQHKSNRKLPVRTSSMTSRKSKKKNKEGSADSHYEESKVMRCPKCREGFSQLEFYQHCARYFDLQSLSWIKHGSEAANTTVRHETEQEIQDLETDVDNFMDKSEEEESYLSNSSPSPVPNKGYSYKSGTNIGHVEYMAMNGGHMACQW